MPKYLVELQWARDIEGATPRKALDKALQMRKEEWSDGDAFQVSPLNGGATSLYEVDGAGEVSECEGGGL